MPVVNPEEVKPKGGAGGARVETNNKVQIQPASGTARFTIEDIWLYPCDEKGKYCKHAGHKPGEKCGEDCPVKGLKSKWSLRLKKQPSIILENRMLCGLGPKSKWQQRVGLLTGTEPGSVECRAVNTDDLVGRDILGTYAYNAETGYTDIKEIMPTEEDPKPIETVPPPQAQPRGQRDEHMVIRSNKAVPQITPRQQQEIDALLEQAYKKGWTPDNVRKNCMKLSDGAADSTDKLAATEADKFFTGLRSMLFKANERARQGQA